MSDLRNMTVLQQERCQVQKPEGPDRMLLVCVIGLLLFGLLMVYSSTSVMTPEAKSGLRSGKEVSQFFFLRKHVLSLCVGVVFMVGAYRMNLMRLHSLAPAFLVGSFFLTVLVFVPGIGLSVNGARRWIQFWPSTLQPSEFVKLAMVIFLARYLSSPAFDPSRITSFLKPVAVLGVFQVLFLKEPDFGAAMTLALITFTLMFLGGVKVRYLLLTGLLVTPVVVKLLMVPYRMKRVLAFLDPFSDQQGSGYQLVQSFIALGSGGLTGVGIGESRQKLDFLPYINTDFIFALMGEELGFLGVTMVIMLFAVLFYRGMKISGRSAGPFQTFLGHGLTYLIVYQMLINVAVVTGLVPTKGLPLPFISYGGTSLLVNMTAVGLLLNLSRPDHGWVTADDSQALVDRKKARIAVYGRGVRNRRRV